VIREDVKEERFIAENYLFEQLKKNSTTMINYQDYFKETDDKLVQLIERRRLSTALEEGIVQNYFEEHPYTLLSVLSSIQANYSFFGSLVLSQPRLKSFHGDRQPDFLIVTVNSLNLYFNFIEIEDPSKKIMHPTRQELSSNFLHSYNQLMQWRAMENEVREFASELLNTLYADNFNNTPEKYKHYNYFLLYGFSNEIAARGVKYNQLLQQYFTNPDMHHCTYSRLINPIKHEPRMFSVKKDATTDSFRAIGWVPFTKYYRDEWSNFRGVTRKEEIIQRSTYLTDEQKQKLIEQISIIDPRSRREIFDLSTTGLGISSFDDLDI
jgi:hypothetical protein